MKKIVWNLAAFNSENVKYLASIMDDSVVTFDEIVESYNEEINFNEKKPTFKCKIFIFYLYFY